MIPIPDAQREAVVALLSAAFSRGEIDSEELERAIRVALHSTDRVEMWALAARFRSEEPQAFGVPFEAQPITQYRPPLRAALMRWIGWAVVAFCVYSVASFAWFLLNR